MKKLLLLILASMALLITWLVLEDQGRDFSSLIDQVTEHPSRPLTERPKESTIPEINPISPKANASYALINSILDANEEELPKLWEQYKNKHLLRPLLIESWARINPAHFLKTDLYSEEEIFLRSAIRHHGESTLQHLKSKHTKIPFALTCLAHDSPQRVLQILKSNPNRFREHTNSTIKDGILRGLAKQNLKLAIDYYHSECSPNNKRLFHRLITDWFLTDSQEAIKWVATGMSLKSLKLVVAR